MDADDGHVASPVIFLGFPTVSASVAVLTAVEETDFEPQEKFFSLGQVLSSTEQARDRSHISWRTAPAGIIMAADEENIEQASRKTTEAILATSLFGKRILKPVLSNDS